MAKTDSATNSHSADLERGESFLDPRVAPLTDRILNNLPEEEDRNATRPSIWRVPLHLRKADQEAYEPKLVSIGPLHRGKSDLLPMEKVKRAYLRKLLNRSKENRLERYVQRILKCLPKARVQYSENLELLSDEDFAEMLVIDGCFIIEYFARRFFHSNDKVTSYLSRVRWSFSHINRDLLLLENQIPFFVLKILFGESVIPVCKNDRPLNLMLLATRFLDLDLPGDQYPEEGDVFHLLHLQHLCMNPKLVHERHGTYSSCIRRAMFPANLLLSAVSVVFFGLMYLIFFRRLPPIFGTEKLPRNQKMTPCATELVEAGVKFKKKVFREYEKACQLKVSFRDGKLEIPFLSVTDDTSAELRNLIALEQCCSHIKFTHFTSYCVFMDNIINTSDDVAVLKSCGILESMLGNDGEVAQLFNTLCEEVNLDTDNRYNKSLFEEVRKFCQFAHHQWRAKLVNTGFKNPWTLFSLVGSILLIALTATQTYFAVYTAFHPQKK